MRHKQKKMKKLEVATILILAFSLSTVSAQESFNATGGNASGEGGSANYSVGQIIYTTHTGANGSVTQGVQQPYEISVVTAIDEAKSINLSVSAYPNPTTDYLTLSIDELEISTMSYHVYDVTGKLIQSEKITGNHTTIGMNNLVPATYFVKVIQGNQEVKTFKIIKK